MSFRGGRGGGSSFQRNLPFGLDYQDINKPQEAEKPTILLPVNGPATENEKVRAQNLVNFQSTVRDGPFFTGDSIEEKEKPKRLEISEEGINDGLKRYSDRYIKKRKIGPSIDDHPYKIEFFPQELYKVMGVDDKKKKKLLALSQLQNSKEIVEKLAKTEEGIHDKLKEVGDEDDEKEEKEEAVEENWDDEFEEDDDDDYNAEKYFDDGEEFGDEDDYNDEAAF